MTDHTAPQPAPTGQGTPILALVLADLRAKADRGELKYGTKLRAFNGRRALVDAYQEQLDLLMYLRQQLEEDRRVVELAGQAAYLETVQVLESLLQDEPTDPATELGRMAIHSNGTLRRAIDALQERARRLDVPVTGRAAAAPLPPRARTNHGWQGERPLRRCPHCKLEEHREHEEARHAVVFIYKRDGREVGRRKPGDGRHVPPCSPAKGAA